MSRILLALFGAALASPCTVRAQTPVRIYELAAPNARSERAFGNVFGIRQLTGGGVLVNDGVRRQLVILDANLGNATVIVDSAAVGKQSYGPRAAPLIPYLADSTLFVDAASLSLLVFDPAGKFARVMSAPQPGDVRLLAASESGVDVRGNLIYRGALPRGGQAAGSGNANGRAPVVVPDSAPILRASFDTRRVDTIGKVKVPSAARANMTQGSDGRMTLVMTINPMVTVDEWAVLSDGSIAFVRGQDYHIDWIRPSGIAVSTSKLPFDWKRVGDEGKQALIDSARTAQERQVATARATGVDIGAASKSEEAIGGGAGGQGRGPGEAGAKGGSGGSGGNGGNEPAREEAPRATNVPVRIEFVPVTEIADYYPAIRAGAAKADLDGNLWILPNTSAQSKAGELVYDVVRANGELSHRVRLPIGRSIAGFGRNGVVYLMNRTDAGWFVERAQLAIAGGAETGPGRPPLGTH